MEYGAEGDDRPLEVEYAKVGPSRDRCHHDDHHHCHHDPDHDLHDQDQNHDHDHHHHHHHHHPRFVPWQDSVIKSGFWRYRMLVEVMLNDPGSSWPATLLFTLLVMVDLAAVMALGVETLDGPNWYVMILTTSD
jgi:hypothetical protein